MEPIAVEARRRTNADPSLELDADLERARGLANLMDSQFELAGVKFGLDALIGLIPVVGDTITLAIGVYPIVLARKHKLGRRTQMRMWMNLGIDWIGGIIPVVGDVFDIAFRANLKNLAILERAAAKQKH